MKTEWTIIALKKFNNESISQLSFCHNVTFELQNLSIAQNQGICIKREISPCSLKIQLTLPLATLGNWSKCICGMISVILIESETSHLRFASKNSTIERKRNTFFSISFLYFLDTLNFDINFLKCMNSNDQHPSNGTKTHWQYKNVNGGKFIRIF